MSVDFTRRQLLTAGGVGAAALGAGAFAYVDPLGLFTAGVNRSPTDWIGRQTGSNSDSWYTFFDQASFDRVAEKLPQDISNAWEDGKSLIWSGDIAAAVDARTALRWRGDDGLTFGFATAGSVDTNAILDRDIPAPAVMSILQDTDKKLNVSIEQVDTVDGLDVYRQTFAPDGPHRAVAMDESTFVFSPAYTNWHQARNSVTATVDSWTDGTGRLTATSDRFDRFVGLLDPGYAGRIRRSMEDHDTLSGATIRFEGDTAIHREVVLDPDLVTADATAYEQAAQEMLGRLMNRTGSSDSVPQVRAEVSDGACTIDVTIPTDVNAIVGSHLRFPSEQYLFKQGVFAV